ncbi:HlyC/CorC family transporter [Cytobacillus oceanisediminis]|uniref:hemolysin family protein n=1 Tax=Bacillaceae TaxID=186817 RepID=UPI000332A091|nr:MULTISPECIES: hemolysin family protein [Bacillaceae]EOR24885.1 Hemolysins-related protein containing CBS domains [Niallia nealsonii AAU1]MBQ6447905.1 HlyC/CorC family transporter [Bacillus sp. (in: firmicutes)]MBZ9533160.1 HlyC/CorC family transporter [Cytobacillus oceanisediminis]UTI39914.1 hemolysin family protein [Niallia sp. RD1]
MGILVLVILIALNAFFAAAEIALISLNDNKIKHMADTGHKKAKIVYKLLSEPSKFLATIQIGITLAGFLASAFAADSFSGQLTELFLTMGIPLSQGLLDSISVIIITLLLSYFTLVFGELVPKRVALKKAEGIAMFAASPLTVLSKITAPFVAFLTFSTNLVARLFGVRPGEEDEEVTEEDIKMMIDVGNERGSIDEDERMMIHNIFEFDNKNVTDIMTHRSNMVAIPSDYTLKEIATLVNREMYTRYPVYEENIDNIIGILHSKDLLAYMGKEDTSFQLSEIIRKPYFVLESKRIDELFIQMQKNNVLFAIVVDEYGGTDGIVTMEDLVEEIVGNIFDEYDEPKPPEIKIIGEHTYLLQGTISLDDVQELLKITLPIEIYDTLSGFLISKIGYIPNDQEKPSITFKNFEFQVEEIVDRRISQIKVTKIIEEESPTNNTLEK